MDLTAVKTSNPLGNSPLAKQAQRFVSHAFFGPILKQMHDSPWQSNMFSGGKAGRNFQSLLDDRLADRMANNPTSNKLVQSIVRKLEKKGKRSESKLIGSPRAVVQNGLDVPANPATADPVDGVLARAAGHLEFLSQAPRIDLKG